MCMQQAADPTDPRAYRLVDGAIWAQGAAAVLLVLVRHAGQRLLVVVVCICLVEGGAAEGAATGEVGGGGVDAGGGSLTPCKQHTERQERSGRQAHGAVFHQRWGSRRWWCWAAGQRRAGGASFGALKGLVSAAAACCRRMRAAFSAGGLLSVSCGGREGERGQSTVSRASSCVTRPRPNHAGAWGMRPGRRRGQERGTPRPSFDDNSAPARLNLDSGAFGVRGRGARGICTRDSRAAHSPPAGPHAPARPWGGLCRGGKRRRVKTRGRRPVMVLLHACQRAQARQKRRGGCERATIWGEFEGLCTRWKQADLWNMAVGRGSTPEFQSIKAPCASVWWKRIRMVGGKRAVDSHERNRLRVASMCLQQRVAGGGQRARAWERPPEAEACPAAPAGARPKGHGQARPCGPNRRAADRFSAQIRPRAVLVLLQNRLAWALADDQRPPQSADNAQQASSQP